MVYLLLFVEGFITFVSPCLLPLLPVYLAYFAGNEKKPLFNAIGFVCGFTLVFVAMGAVVGAVGSFLLGHQRAISILAGAAIMVLGFSYIGLIKLPGRLQVRPAWLDNLNFMKAAIFGMLFAVAWTPCVSAFLGAALLRAGAQGEIIGGMRMLFVFSMGLGVPLIASAVLIHRLKSVFEFFKRYNRIISAVAGLVLITMGILMVTGRLIF